MNIYRQGDVTLVEVDNIPENSEKVAPDNNRVILAYGEVTGHAHAIPVKDAIQYKNGLDEFVEILEKTFLRHEEHDQIALPPGRYKKYIAREYQNEGIVRVVD